MKTFLRKIFYNAATLNRKNIQNFLKFNDEAVLLDLGCDDGEFTVSLAEKLKCNTIHGVEIVPERIELSERKGIIVKNFDLNGRFEYNNESFDIIHANQVIEHIYNSDNFLSEIHRILKPGGFAIISTENASSWCNIFACLLGWQIFSLTNFSNKKQGIGNPFSIHRGENPELSSWNHVRIYNIRGLKEYFEAFGFKVEQIKGAGYFPLPAILGNIDKTHSHFITFKVVK